MSLDKAIQSGKEHRKPYRGSKACAENTNASSENRTHKTFRSMDFESIAFTNFAIEASPTF